MLEWHYAPAAVRSSSVQATLRFNLAAANTGFHGVAYTAEMTQQPGELTKAQRAERLMVELQRAMEDSNVKGSQRDEYKEKLAAVKADLAHIQAERENMSEGERLIVTREGYSVGKAEASQGPLRLVAVKSERVSEEAMSEVMKRAGLKIGDPITEDSMKSLRDAAAAVDEHLKVVMHDDGRGGVSLVLVSRE